MRLPAVAVLDGALANTADARAQVLEDYRSRARSIDSPWPPCRPSGPASSTAVPEPVVGLVAELMASPGRGRADQEPGRPRPRPAAPIRRVVPSDAGIDVRFGLPGDFGGKSRGWGGGDEEGGT